MFDIKSTLPVDGIEEVEEELDLLRRVLLLLGRRRQPLWKQLYKNWSSRKINSQIIFSRE